MSAGNSDPPRRGALLALVVIAALIGVAMLIIHRLHRNAAIQDCVVSGRRDCAPIDAGAR